MLIHQLLMDSADRRPESILLVHGERRTTYGEVETATNRLARLLLELGLARGDRVGLLLPNSLLYLVAYYATLKAGAMSVALHAGSDPRTIRRLLRDCSARALLAGPRIADRVAEAAEGLPDLRHVLLPDDEPDGAAFPDHVRVSRFSASDALEHTPPHGFRVNDLDPAMIVYTSGSTGQPRGATLTHLNIVENTRSIVSYLDLTEKDRGSVVLPFPYVYGKSLLNTHVAVGGSLVLHDSLVFPNVVLDIMERESVTGFSGVPSTYAILLNRSDLARRSFPSLRYVTQAGGAMPVPHLERLMEALPGVRIFVMYGATEASARLSYLEPEALPRKLGSIGRAIPNVELTVRRGDGTEAAAGEVGEIVARGSNIMRGYWGDTEASAEVLDKHGFHTGDLGWRDEEGYLWVTGRSREMIKSGAHRISPREIEEALLECPAVDEAAVVGVPDEYLGEEIVAHVTLRPGTRTVADELLLFCEERLPPHKVPRVLRIRRAMPRNPAGKIDKNALGVEERS